MNFAMIFKVALRAIMRNKTRSVLTCIGIIVGIAAVIAVMAIGQGAQTMMVKQISSMGNNLVMVFPERRRAGSVSSGRGQGQTMTAADAMAVKTELAHSLSSHWASSQQWWLQRVRTSLHRLLQPMPTTWQRTVAPRCFSEALTINSSFLILATQPCV